MPDFIVELHRSMSEREAFSLGQDALTAAGVEL